MLRSLAFYLITVIPVSVFAATAYQIEAAVNDEKFLINGERFEAQTYCFGWDRGQRVIFTENAMHALGACAATTLYNLDRKETCKVWCE